MHRIVPITAVHAFNALDGGVTFGAIAFVPGIFGAPFSGAFRVITPEKVAPSEREEPEVRFVVWLVVSLIIVYPPITLSITVISLSNASFFRNADYRTLL